MATTTTEKTVVSTTKASVMSTTAVNQPQERYANTKNLFFRNDVFYAYLSRILLKTTNPRIINTKFTKKFITDQTEKLFFKAAQACSDHR